MKNYRLLMLTTLIISGCSICYELIISAVSSYLLGDSNLQYSITIGLYMSAMGLGSYLSKYIKKNLFNCFVMVEISVGIVGGFSAFVLFMANLYLASYQLIMYFEIIVIGTLVGVEIPLLTRIIESDREDLRLTLSSLFSFDYIGGLIGSIAFPIILLPQLGYFATAFLTGAMNLVAALVIVFKYAKQIKKVVIFKITASCILAVMIIGALFSEDITEFVEGGLYRDRVIFSEHSKYQHIVMTKDRDDLRLFIDGNTQFSSMDEYRYHEALVHIPMSKASNKEKVLVLGGGDGMALREILKYPEAEITLVDLDERMTELCSTEKQIVELNGGSLSNERVTVYNQDAFQFLEDSKDLYDVIIVDLPDPNNEALNKLYSNVFYRLCGNALTEDGVMTVQSTSPYYATDAFWCINKTLESEGFFVKPYHLQVPSFGDWGFNLASKKQLDDSIHLTVETRYLSEEQIPSMFAFAKDEISTRKLEINHMTKPSLIYYYYEAIKNWE